MLVDNLYRVVSNQKDAAVIRVHLEVNASHEIFKGHFPEVPVLPGVCMVQCIKELIEESLLVKTQIDKGDMIKFLSMLNPVESNSIQAEISIKEKTETRIVFQATLKNEDRFLLKYSGSLVVLN
ncbi:(3R)-hydroxymyristoyl-ACP dehydratase [Cytophaga hutchinsonii]|jgi:3-hydroxyacyl-[acyl-carrier-protein] dehydratase|uniref:3-hydroxymyristoyl/3-hydroxydecanoyl-(Acyl carrier protein) dehydratase n=1 Tax=Cytophaga hutchinsonii (strain ATCC 33406 / DSM 1761 / CIP 103989 / NBRC 15051 / NCIMB 9469 / D465) TaxID=269798 RepID=A0A6N4SSL8_CYTH3|nr:(3R)-hydroxymyristoyl-ACP dehydratase [Cytophaga hutchinsonii]ABG59373.1 3-hydroxymyristoyl/3-hydroxydecanoyl-(acyl carrier protein) dehydratase [Cytophaga hutchinsonii ATCC 33406]SFX92535.1 3-hydroxyacyl-[acyl-carrier-protein] dehydratase [Cytophaga hutchinsonii ATCC 33406]